VLLLVLLVLLLPLLPMLLNGCSQQMCWKTQTF
jgi:hypothetical protein